MRARRRLLASIPSRQIGYPHLHRIETRWHDNDSFGHVNNVVYYNYMDTAVNTHLLKNGIDELRVVASSSCRYMTPMAYPQPALIGLGVSKLGRSSVAYKIGIFSVPFLADGNTTNGAEDATLCAEGTFTHVYVDAAGKSTPLADHARTLLSTLLID